MVKGSSKQKLQVCKQQQTAKGTKAVCCRKAKLSLLYDVQLWLHILPGAILLLFIVNNIVYKQKRCDVAHVVIDMYVPNFMSVSLCSWIMLVEEVEEEDEQNSLS